MIYLVTGTPGAGKSLYAISTLVQELMGRVLKRKGQEVKRRLLVDGVSGLIIPHEKLAPGEESEDGTLKPTEGQGIWNWFEWCQPGDVIFVDEVQRWFRPRGMGTKVPPEIKHLETHRHLGVDFVFVTQNPMLLDQNIRRLVYRHQHIRRLWGMQRSMIYEWDGTAENVKSTKAATMSFWNYPKSAYDLYQSSELHTKPKSKVPVWAFLPIVAALGLVAVAPTAFSTMKGAMSGKGVGSSPPASFAESNPVQNPAPLPASPSPAMPAIAPGLGPAGQQSPAGDAPKFAGCAILPDSSCRCFDTVGKKVDMDIDFCTDLTARRGSKPVTVALAELPRSADYSADALDRYALSAVPSKEVKASGLDRAR